MNMTKLTKASLATISTGLVTVGFTFIYYHFHLGIKPCEDLPTDASNCGDADFGGVYFIMVGVPIILIGIIGLLIAGIRYYCQRKSRSFK